MARRRSRAPELQPRVVDRAVDAVLIRRPSGPIVRRWRRILAVATLVLAGVLAARDGAAVPSGSPMVQVTADLPVGTVLSADDLVVRRGDPPDGVLPDIPAVAGRILAGPIRRGEIVTDARLVPADGPDPGPGRVAVPVTPDDPALLGLLHPGMRVAVMGLPAEGPPLILTDDAVVVALGEVVDARTSRPVVLGVRLEEADAVAGATLAGRVTFRFS